MIRDVNGGAVAGSSHLVSYSSDKYTFCIRKGICYMDIYISF